MAPAVEFLTSPDLFPAPGHARATSRPRRARCFRTWRPRSPPPAGPDRGDRGDRGDRLTHGPAAAALRFGVAGGRRCRRTAHRGGRARALAV